LYLVYINDTEKRAYYRMWNLVNESLSLSGGFEDNIFCPLKVVHLYRNMSKLLF